MSLHFAGWQKHNTPPLFCDVVFHGHGYVVPGHGRIACGIQYYLLRLSAEISIFSSSPLTLIHSMLRRFSFFTKDHRLLSLSISYTWKRAEENQQELSFPFMGLQVPDPDPPLPWL